MNLIISNHTLLPEVSKVINLSNIVYIYVNLLNKIGNINLGENNTLNVTALCESDSKYSEISFCMR